MYVEIVAETQVASHAAGKSPRMISMTHPVGLSRARARRNFQATDVSTIRCFPRSRGHETSLPGARPAELIAYQFQRADSADAKSPKADRNRRKTRRALYRLQMDNVPVSLSSILNYTTSTV